MAYTTSNYDRFSEPLIKNRNFDPESRTLKKHKADDFAEDTVEKRVDGMAAQIIADDEKRRAQELVCPLQLLSFLIVESYFV